LNLQTILLSATDVEPSGPYPFVQNHNASAEIPVTGAAGVVPVGVVPGPSPADDKYGQA
jgi:hypothetical protein